MNPKKRKADDEDDSCENKTEFLKEDGKNESLDVSNCGSGECGNLTDQQKSDNGGSKEEPGTSDGKCSDKESNNCANLSSDQPEKKNIHLAGPEASGTLLFCGGTNWDLIGRKELPKTAKGAGGVNLWGPHRIASLQGIKVTGVYAGSCAVHSVIITEGGKPYTWGRNDKGQLGHCDTKRRDTPTLVDTLKDHNIISAACGRSHTLFLSERGIVYSCGDNKMGQCGVGSQNNAINIPTKVPFKGKSITKLACGAEFSVICDAKGGMHSFGLPEYGQLGHNSDGKYFVTSNKLSFRCEVVPRRIIAFIEKTREGHVTLVDDVHIIDVACGINHSVAIDSKKRCFSWGFGGYGRLGHAEQKDEMVPRLIKSFDGPNRGVKKAFAGGTYSMAVNEFDVLYFWGQNRRSGEATMYPKPVPDLVGWSVRDVGCSNTSVVCVADESVISWGASPTYGELGYGESRPKSSTTPQEVKPLNGLHIQAVACGYGHTLLIARDEAEEDQKELNKLPEYSP
ncbi:protein RCC2 homolog [Parasteatoda tepidariorum]|uniref:protein RCC2 homolog n=1 Tax=Parasteatoda tepidariorum TaxID=114398 RepID=UPI001C718A25|nr:protein RCC2 homolog [Parasteatoda tepidariorum]